MRLARCWLLRDHVQVRYASFFCTAALTPMLSVLPGCAHRSTAVAQDLVVRGQVETLSYEALDELGLNGRMTARLTITRVISGRPPSPVLTVRYIAHSYLPADRSVRLRLRRSDEDTWLICSESGGRGYICR